MTTVPQPYGRRVLICFIAFFLTFMVVDAIFVAIAVNSNTGIVTRQAYEKGLAYNETLQAIQDQKALGWTGRIDMQGNTLRYDVKDARGRPLSGAAVQAKIERRVASGLDQTVTLAEIAPGLYESQIDFPKPGSWHVRIFVQWQTHTYQQATSVAIRP